MADDVIATLPITFTAFVMGDLKRNQYGDWRLSLQIPHDADAGIALSKVVGIPLTITVEEWENDT